MSVMHFKDPETKQESMVWKHTSSPPPKKALVQRSAGKVFYTVFWDMQGIIVADPVPKGVYINAAY